MPTRGLLILTVVTLIAVVVCGFALNERYRQVTPRKQQGDLVFPRLQHEVSGITEVAVIRANSRFTLARDASGWANRGIGGYPALSKHVEKVIVALAGLKYLSPKTGRPALHHKLGVEDVTDGVSSTQLSLKNAIGEVLANVVVGKPKENIAGADRPGLYLRLPGNARAWLVSGSLDVRYDAVDWSDRKVVDIDPRSLTVLTVRHANGEVVALHRKHAGDPKLTLQNLPDGATVLHQHQIDYMSGLFQGLEFNDARRRNDSDNGGKIVFQARAQSTEQLTVTLRAGNPQGDGSVWAEIDAEVTNNAQASDQARQDAARITSAFGDWSVKFPRTINDRLGIALDDIIGTDATSQ